MRSTKCFAVIGVALGASVSVAAHGALPCGLFGDDAEGAPCGIDVCGRSERCCNVLEAGGACGLWCIRGPCLPSACDAPNDPEEE